MIVSCPSCEKKYKFSEDKLGKRGAKITCPKCRHVFVVYKDRETESLGRKLPDGTLEADNRVTGRPAPQRDPWPRDFPTWSFRELGATWRVRKQQGLTYDFYSLEELHGFLDERQVARTDEISINGRDWVRIDGFSDLTAYFYDMWKRVEAGEIELDDEDEDEEDEADAPTTIMGAASSLADEIRRAVQDARTPAPAADRIRATPRPPTPRGPAPRAQSPQPAESRGGGFVSPPQPTPTWGGPSEEWEDEPAEPLWGDAADLEEPEISVEDDRAEPTWGSMRAEPTWGASPSREEEPAAPALPPRPDPQPISGGGPAKLSNAPGRSLGRPPASPPEPMAAPPTPIHDPFEALTGGAGKPQPSAPPPPKLRAKAPAQSGGGGGVWAIIGLLLLVGVLAVGGGLAGLKLGWIPADAVPVDLPPVLLPDAPAEPEVDAPAEVPAEGVEGEGTAEGEAPAEEGGE